jgi:hypothetical protein
MGGGMPLFTNYLEEEFSETAIARPRAHVTSGFLVGNLFVFGDARVPRLP